MISAIKKEIEKEIEREREQETTLIGVSSASRPDARYVINYTSRCTPMAKKWPENYYNRKHNEIICTNGVHRNTVEE